METVLSPGVMPLTTAYSTHVHDYGETALLRATATLGCSGVATIISTMKASESPIARDNSCSRSHTSPRRKPRDVRRSGSGRPAPQERRRIG